jgi:CRISPR/Cas system-associated exonuclease Cas4 (RecB family)
VFQYVKDLKEIEDLFQGAGDEQLKLIKQFWTALYAKGGKDDDPKVRKQFLQFWQILNSLYTDYKNMLEQKGVGYEGMVYRKVAELAIADKLNYKGKRPVFVGFNALSTSEKAIFEQAKNAGALFYWDYDQYYIDDTMQEAGYFMRSNLTQFPSALTNKTEFSNIEQSKTIAIKALPGEVEMATAATNALTEIKSDKSNPLKNGLILANESLLPTILDTMPPEVEGLNITMGLPSKNSGIFAFVQVLLQVGKQSVTRNKELFYKNEWVIELLMQAIHHESNDSLVAELRQSNQLYIPAQKMTTDEWLSKLFPTERKPLIDYLIGILAHWIDTCNPDNENTANQINCETALLMYKALLQLNQQLAMYNLQLPDTIILRLISKILSGLTITLEGEPLRGIQLMGLIETRSLDFEHLIMVGVNEGFMPKSSVAPSFIPYNLRKAYGLLTFEHQDAIFAYYFYRAIQRASSITFIYNSDESDSDYGEPSRFLQQLTFELHHKVEENHFSHTLSTENNTPLIIHKTPEVKALLNKYAEGRKLFPIQLNSYINCSLQFYFRYLVKMKEPDKLEAGVDQRIFGLVFHDTMEELYLPFQKKNESLTPESIQKLNNDALILESIRNNMKTHYANLELQRIDNGLVTLIEQVVLRYVKRMLRNDARQGEFRLYGLEDEYTREIAVNDTTYTLAGKVDRMQLMDNNIFVIDYKTGRVPTTSPKFADLFDFGNNKRSDAVFQAMHYAYVVAGQSFSTNTPLVPALLYIQEDKPVQELLFGDRKGESFAQMYDDFEHELKKLLAHLFDDHTPFYQTENVNHCKFCPYSVICGRTDV